MLPNQRPGSTLQPRPAGGGTSASRNPILDNTTYILILVVVLVPIIFTLILCSITYCIYRYNKKRLARAPTNSPIVPTDRSGRSAATVIYNTQHSPFIHEELPPSYDSLGEIKKDLRNTNEHIQLTEVPNSANAILPTAPTPPPSYINLDESNKQ